MVSSLHKMLIPIQGLTAYIMMFFYHIFVSRWAALQLMAQPSGFAEKNYTMVVLLIDTMLAYIIRFYIITRILLFFAQNYDLTITKFCDSYIALVCSFCNLSMPLKKLLKVAFTDGNSTLSRLIIWYRSAANPHPYNYWSIYSNEASQGPMNK